MSQIGEYLKKVRTQKHLTIDEAADGTGIRAQYLEALEKGDYARIPGDVFIKGFIRNYGNFLDLDGNALVEEYKAAAKTAAKTAGRAVVDKVEEEIMETASPTDSDVQAAVDAVIIRNKQRTKPKASFGQGIKNAFGDIKNFIYDNLYETVEEEDDEDEEEEVVQTLPKQEPVQVPVPPVPPVIHPIAEKEEFEATQRINLEDVMLHKVAPAAAGVAATAVAVETLGPKAEEVEANAAVEEGKEAITTQEASMPAPVFKPVPEAPKATETAQQVPEFKIPEFNREKAEVSSEPVDMEATQVLAPITEQVPKADDPKPTLEFSHAPIKEKVQPKPQSIKEVVEEEDDEEYYEPKKKKQNKSFFNFKIFAGVFCLLVLCFAGVMGYFMFGNRSATQETKVVAKPGAGVRSAHSSNNNEGKADNKLSNEVKAAMEEDKKKDTNSAAAKEKEKAAAAVAAAKPEAKSDDKAKDAAKTDEKKDTAKADNATKGSGDLVVEVTYKEPVWTQVTADGKTIEAAVIPKGATRVFKGNNTVKVNVGALPNVTIKVNGKVMDYGKEYGEATKTFTK